MNQVVKTGNNFSFGSHHGVDPLPDIRTFFEIMGVGKIQAAAIGNSMVNDSNFPMQADICSRQQGAKQ